MYLLNPYVHMRTLSVAISLGGKIDRSGRCGHGGFRRDGMLCLAWHVGFPRTRPERGFRLVLHQASACRAILVVCVCAYICIEYRREQRLACR